MMDVLYPEGITDGSRWLSAANTAGTERIIVRRPRTQSHIHLRSLRDRTALCLVFRGCAAARQLPATIYDPSGINIHTGLKAISNDPFGINIPKGLNTVAGG